MAAGSRVAVAVTGAATTVLVARLLGPSGAGGFAIALTMIVLLTVGTTLGIEHGIAYYVSAGRWPAARASRAAQRMALVVGALGAGAALGARAVFPSAFGNLSVGTVAVAACALPFGLSWLYFTYIAVATDRYEGFALPPALQSTLALLFVAALAPRWGVAGAVAGFAVAHVATAAATTVASRRFGRLASPEDGTAGVGGTTGEDGTTIGLGQAARFGVKGYLANALQVVNYRLDLFVLAAAAGAGVVGHYAVAVAVTGVLWLLPQALSDVLFPRVAALSARSDSDSAATLEFVETKTMRHTVVVVGAATCALAAALVFLVVPVFGAAFRPAIALGLILLPGVALLGLTNPMATTLVGRGHPGYGLAIALVVTPLTVALYAVLIPLLHGTGAALASTISYTSSFLLIGFFYRRVTGRPLRLCLVPTRSEFADYRALVPAIRQWATNRRSGGAVQAARATLR
jgi:O-antigen/teichoic acid export membrane protein